MIRLGRHGSGRLKSGACDENRSVSQFAGVPNRSFSKRMGILVRWAICMAYVLSCHLAGRACPVKNVKLTSGIALTDGSTMVPLSFKCTWTLTCGGILFNAALYETDASFTKILSTVKSITNGATPELSAKLTDNRYYKLTIRQIGQNDTTTIRFRAFHAYALPQITRQPADSWQCSGLVEAFTVQAKGEDLHYAWHFQPSHPDARGSDFVLEEYTTATLFTLVYPEAEGRYYCTVSNPKGSVRSASGTLYCEQNPVLDSENTTLESVADSNGFAFFFVATDFFGSQLSDLAIPDYDYYPFFYRWYTNGVPIPGEFEESLLIQLDEHQPIPLIECEVSNISFDCEKTWRVHMGNVTFRPPAVVGAAPRLRVVHIATDTELGTAVEVADAGAGVLGLSWSDAYEIGTRAGFWTLQYSYDAVHWGDVSSEALSGIVLAEDGGDIPPGTGALAQYAPLGLEDAPESVPQALFFRLRQNP